MGSRERRSREAEEREKTIRYSRLVTAFYLLPFFSSLLYLLPPTHYIPTPYSLLPHQKDNFPHPRLIDVADTGLLAKGAG